MSTMFRDEIPVYSMDNVAYFGQKFSTSVSFRRAVELERIVPIKIHLVDVDSDSVKSIVEDASSLTISSATDSVTLDTEGQKYLALACIATRKVLQDLTASGEVRKTIAFMGRTADCARSIDPNHPLSLVRGDVHNIKTYEYHSNISMRTRRHIRGEFADHTGPALMTAVRAIREGVSINDVDAVILMRGYGTDDVEGISVELIQHIGRAVRTSKGKDCAHVIIPIPAIGVADAIRNRILQMVVSLMEEFEILPEVIQLMMDSKSGKATRGSLRNIGINIVPPTTIAEQDIIDALTDRVIDFTKTYRSDLYQQMNQAQYDDTLQDLVDLL